MLKKLVPGTLYRDPPEDDVGVIVQTLSGLRTQPRVLEAWIFDGCVRLIDSPRVDEFIEVLPIDD